MHETRRAAVMGAVTLAVLAMSACTSGSDGSAESVAAPTSVDPAARPPGAAPPNSHLDSPEPSVVASDAPVTAPTSGEAEVLITYASWEPSTEQVEVGAYVESVAENGGSCTLTLSRDGESVTATAPAEADARTTGCLGLAAAGDRLSSGTWTAVVTYRSDAHEGTSGPVEVAVP